MFVSIEWAWIVSATKTADVYRSIEAKKLANIRRKRKKNEREEKAGAQTHSRKPKFG